jgi:hypothetical protein
LRNPSFELFQVDAESDAQIAETESALTEMKGRPHARGRDVESRERYRNLKRLRPALPGFKKRTPPTVWIFGEWELTGDAKVDAGCARIETQYHEIVQHENRSVDGPHGSVGDIRTPVTVVQASLMAVTGAIRRNA